MKIAVDGPAGSGKSTVAREISARLGIPYIETGLAYRGMGYLVHKYHGGIEEPNWSVIQPLLDKLRIIPRVGYTEVLIEEQRIDEELKSESAGRYASMVGTIPEFRRYINDVFRKLIGDGQVVVEGRDAGTNIIPDADVKLFITADPRERALRRKKQLEGMGMSADYEEILAKIIERDERDTSRKDSPLKPAQDAVVIDTTGKSLEEVIEEVLSVINRVRG